MNEEKCISIKFEFDELLEVYLALMVARTEGYSIRKSLVDKIVTALKLGGEN